jgi:CHAT domain-containing protein
MENVRLSLPAGAGLIETGKHENSRWAAVLALSEAEEEAVLFEDLGPVEATMKTWLLMRLAEDTGKAKQYAAALWQNLFGKFEKHLQNINTLYIAPDGFLNLVSFASLILPDGTYWIEKQALRRIQTGRDLLRSPDKAGTGTLLALGGVDFDHHPEQTDTAKKQDDMLLASAADNERAANELGKFKFLPESRKEVKKIASIYKQCRKTEAQALTGSQAGESVLKHLTAPPRVLHLSTHGFYLGNDEHIERPLVLSGLALAGANLGLENKPGKDGEDGILYSMEILGLNLRGTELVSLSACNTGMGVVDYSEGVYGLVRAFRIAGANAVLMTLRSVKDSQAKDFMTTFYRNWLQKGSDPGTALRETQLYYIGEKENPKMWAPYVVVGK